MACWIWAAWRRDRTPHPSFAKSQSDQAALALSPEGRGDDGGTFLPQVDTELAEERDPSSALRAPSPTGGEGDRAASSVPNDVGEIVPQRLLPLWEKVAERRMRGW